ncbi:MAG: PEP-CTERM sorting domain-containing protein [Gammaproteobacteria bacterium]|nr:PEP-CTERM sorting domain-containing protein [Gammaproteobacteria bacterium]
MNKHFLKITAVALLAFAASNANATIFVPGGGNTGMQSFAIAFQGGPADVTMNIGVSNAGDGAVGPNQNNINFTGLLAGLGSVFLDGNNGVDTSAYTGEFGQPGTTGDIFSTTFNVDCVDPCDLTFDWQYQSVDGGSFQDFSFVEFLVGDQQIYYDVLAQDTDDCVTNQCVTASEPGVVLLMGLGMVLLGLRRRFS